MCDIYYNKESEIAEIVVLHEQNQPWSLLDSPRREQLRSL